MKTKRVGSGEEGKQEDETTRLFEDASLIERNGKRGSGESQSGPLGMARDPIRGWAMWQEKTFFHSTENKPTLCAHTPWQRVNKSTHRPPNRPCTQPRQTPPERTVSQRILPDSSSTAGRTSSWYPPLTLRRRRTDSHRSEIAVRSRRSVIGARGTSSRWGHRQRGTTCFPDPASIGFWVDRTCRELRKGRIGTQISISFRNSSIPSTLVAQCELCQTLNVNRTPLKWPTTTTEPAMKPSPPTQIHPC